MQDEISNARHDSRKPLRRSVAFWSGLFVLSFLVWVWGDSFFHQTGMLVGGASPKRFLIKPGMLTVEWESSSHPGFATPTVPPGIGFRRSKQQHRPPWNLWFPDFYGWSDGMRYFYPPGTPGPVPGASSPPPGVPGFPFRSYHVQVALWMPATAFLVIWGIGTGLWRKWQGQKALEFISS